jgi:hypothetical protein
MVVARSLNNPRMADRLRAAACDAALQLGGWATSPGDPSAETVTKRRAA